jgi:hypothetical protein
MFNSQFSSEWKETSFPLRSDENWELNIGKFPVPPKEFDRVPTSIGR